VSFGLYSEQGYLADLASIEGWSDVVDFLKDQKCAEECPELASFAETGYSYSPAKVKAELGKLLVSVRIRDSSVRDTLKNLEAKLARAKEIAIVHG
jgi:hypothetical protein